MKRTSVMTAVATMGTKMYTLDKVKRAADEEGAVSVPYENLKASRTVERFSGRRGGCQVDMGEQTGDARSATALEAASAALA